MNDNFEKAFHELILVEGGYVDHPLDPGGKTKYGITEEVARSIGNYTGDMRDLPLELAKEIYYKSYYKNYNFDLIQNYKIASELFEFTVNTGRADKAVEFLQESYNLMNISAEQLKVDGKLGSTTARTINGYKYYKSLHKSMNIMQGAFYIDIVRKKSSHKAFYRGWIDNRVTL